MKRNAAIDLGTNTARLLVAEVGEGSFTPLHLERRIIRLGGGFTHDRGIAPDAWERGLSTMQSFSLTTRELGVERIRAVATSAVRDAPNGGAFCDAVHDRYGIRLEVIDGTEEAMLTLRGVASGVRTGAPSELVFDVGGGSTEYTLSEGFSPRMTASLPMGVVRLTEGFGGDPGPIRDKVRRLLMEYRDDASRRGFSRLIDEACLIGTAGTATTLAAIDLGLRQYDYRVVNGHGITREFAVRLLERMLPMKPVERLSIVGLEPGREDLIIAGMIITIETMEIFGFDEMIVSDSGLLEGVLLSTIDTS